MAHKHQKKLLGSIIAKTTWEILPQSGDYELFAEDCCGICDVDAY